MKFKKHILIVVATLVFSVSIANCNHVYGANNVDTTQSQGIPHKDKTRNDPPKESYVTEKDFKDHKSSVSLWMIIAFIACSLSLIISSYTLFRLAKVEARSDRHRRDITNLQNHHNMLVNMLNNLNNNTYRKDIKDLQGQINNLNRLINKPATAPKTAPNNNYVPPKPKQENKVEVQNMYFGTPSKMSETEAYFKSLLKSQDSEARFSAIVRANRAEFYPINTPQSLSVLKSSDLIKMAVECQGCAPSEANSFIVNTNGIAVLNGTNWEIKEKTIISFQR